LALLQNVHICKHTWTGLPPPPDKLCPDNPVKADEELSRFIPLMNIPSPADNVLSPGTKIIS